MQKLNQLIDVTKQLEAREALRAEEAHQSEVKIAQELAVQESNWTKQWEAWAKDYQKEAATSQQEETKRLIKTIKNNFNTELRNTTKAHAEEVAHLQRELQAVKVSSLNAYWWLLMYDTAATRLYEKMRLRCCSKKEGSSKSGKGS